MASRGIRTKRVFISDIHMGDQQSLDPPDNLHPYGWFHQDRGRMLGDFLGLKLNDPEVKEIIILGDLFDMWVYPAELEPPDEKEHLKRIAHAYQNREVIRRLRSIAACDEIDLIYVQGNHDMWTSTMTVPCWKDFLNKLFPGINTDYIEGGIFGADGIVAEHGNKYCLFNASGRSGNPGGVLPLGYFITRAVTERVAETGKATNSLEVVEYFLRDLFVDEIKDAFSTIFGWLIHAIWPEKKVLHKIRHFVYPDFADLAKVERKLARKAGPRDYDQLRHWLKCYIFPEIGKVIGRIEKDEKCGFAEAFFRAIVKDSDLCEESPVRMNSVDGYSGSVTVVDVEKQYADLYDQWGCRNGVVKEQAVMDEHLLGLVAITNYLGVEKIVIFGHTHDHRIEGHPSSNVETQAKELKESKGPYEQIYANCGTWINGKDCTFVETEIKDGRHYVRSKQYKEDGTIHPLGDERYIEL